MCPGDSAILTGVAFLKVIEVLGGKLVFLR